MKNVLLLAFATIILFAFNAFSQEEEGTSLKSLVERFETVDENITTLNNDVSSLKKIKITGYYQFEFYRNESLKGVGTDPYDSKDIVQNQFRIRRGRLKVTYDGGLTQYVLQGDFLPSGFSLKDFYLDLKEPWLKYFTLRAGLFNRPNFEVEFSSSQRESMERSLVIRTLYPGERDLGAMLIVNPDEMFNFQFAAFNNTYLGGNRQFFPNFRDEAFYYMARLTKTFDFPEAGFGVDLGVHARIGNLRSNSKYVIESDQAKVDSSKTIKVGDNISRTWFGAEAQLFWDFLGGVKLMTEVIFGKNTDEPKADGSAIRKREFLGYYVYFVKNIGDYWQVALKYDSYNPNTKIDKSKIISTSDLAVNTLGFGIHNYYFPNIRISLWYDMLKTQTSDNIVGGKKLLETDPVDNTLTVRFQYKF